MVLFSVREGFFTAGFISCKLGEKRHPVYLQRVGFAFLSSAHWMGSFRMMLCGGFRGWSLKMMIFRDISGRVYWVFIWKKPRTPVWLGGIPLWCNRNVWYCIKCMNLLTISIEALFILLTIYIPSLFGGKWRSAQQTSHFRTKVPKFRTQKIHRFPI